MACSVRVPPYTPMSSDALIFFSLMCSPPFRLSPFPCPPFVESLPTFIGANVVLSPIFPPLSPDPPNFGWPPSLLREDTRRSWHPLPPLCRSLSPGLFPRLGSTPLGNFQVGEGVGSFPFEEAADKGTVTPSSPPVFYSCFSLPILVGCNGRVLLIDVPVLEEMVLTLLSCPRLPRPFPFLPV